MASVDDRIVRMEFDNASFERKIDTTLASLSQLEKALKFTDAGKGFNEISQAAGRVDLSSMANSLESIAGKFTALGAIGFSVIQNLTVGFLDFAKKIGGDILGPIITGGTQRAKNIEQAKFMFEGLGIDVTEAMANALDAVRGTAFGLDEAAKAAAQFGASGIATGKDLTAALRGVAGAAAMTGSSFTEMADIFAGSAGSGKVNNMDLQQFATRGLNAAAAVGKVMGKTEAQIHEMAAAGELDFKTFAAAMDVAFGAHATEANKTFTGALANLHAAMSRLGAAVIAPQLSIFREIFNALSPAIDSVTAAIKPLIDHITFLSDVVGKGVINAIKNLNFDNLKAAMPAIDFGLVNIFKALQGIFEIGKEAFRNIFPAGTESLIVKLADGFQKITEHLILSASAAEKIKSIFEGFFSILAIGWEILKQGTLFLIGIGKALLGIGGSKVVDFFVNLGDSLVRLKESLVDGGKIKAFFDGLTEALKRPIAFLKEIKDALGNVFSLFDKNAPAVIGDSLSRMGDRFAALGEFFHSLGRLWEPFQSALEKIMPILDRIFGLVQAWFKEFADRLAKVMKEGDFSAVLDAINVGLLGGIAALLAKFLKNGIKLTNIFSVDIGKGLFGAITRDLDQLRGVLSAMQQDIKADALMKIATAIGILTASVLVLSMIDSEALSKALAAMAVGFGELMGSFAALTKLANGPKAAASFDLIATGMIALATALLILSFAVRTLAKLKWGDLIKGLAGVTALMIILTKLAPKLAENSKGMVRAGLSMIGLAIGLGILALSMKIFASMSWEEMTKGLLGVAASLTMIVLFMKALPDDMPKIAFQLMGISLSLLVLGAAVAIFGHMDWETMGKGFLAIATGLGIIAIAMHAMPNDMAARSAGLAAVGFALLEISGAVKILGGMSFEDLAKGLGSIGVSLGLLAVGLHFMDDTLAGSAAMLVAATSLVVLAGALKLLSKMKWQDLAKGLGAIAVSIGIFAIAADAAAEAIPIMYALGLSIALLGVGFALMGAAVWLVAKGLQALSTLGAKAAENIIIMAHTLSAIIPTIIRGMAEGLVELAMVFVKAAPVITKALAVFIGMVIDTLIVSIPKLAELLGLAIDKSLEIIHAKFPLIQKEGYNVLIKFLKGIRDNIGPITSVVSDIVVNFFNKLTEKVPELAESFKNLIVEIITQASEKLGEISGTILFDVGVAFMTGLFHGFTDSLGPVLGFFTGLGDKILEWIGNVVSKLWQKGIDFLQGLWNGITDGVQAVITFFQELPGNIVNWVGDVAGRLWDKGNAIIGGFFNGMTSKFSEVISWIGGIPSQIVSALPGPQDALNLLVNIGGLILQGFKNGLEAVWRDIKDFIGSIADWIRDHKGPAEKDAVLLYDNGKLIMQGLHKGMEEEWKNTQAWINNLDPAENLDKGLMANMTKVISDAADQMSNMEEFNPTITPVLDLTQVAAEASKISGYITASDILIPNVSNAQAQSIASAQRANADSAIQTTVPPAEGITFTQINNSPTQLSTSDIYKQTRNQIRIAKEELSIP